MRQLLLSASVELLWLLLIACFSFACIYPIHGIIANQYILVNGVLAFLIAFYFRIAVFFRHIFYLQFLAVQVLLFFSHPLLFLKTWSKMQELFYQFDSYDLTFFIIPGLRASTYEMNDAFHFFKKEFILLSVGWMILIVAVELRVLLAFIERIRKME